MDPNDVITATNRSHISVSFQFVDLNKFQDQNDHEHEVFYRQDHHRLASRVLFPQQCHFSLQALWMSIKTSTHILVDAR
jgi:hypothetical protein